MRQEGIEAWFPEAGALAQAASEVDAASLRWRSPQQRFWLIDPLDGTKEFASQALQAGGYVRNLDGDRLRYGKGEVPDPPLVAVFPWLP
jgi:hypothetical protein